MFAGHCGSVFQEMESEQEEQHVTHLFGGVGAGESHQRPERDAHAHDDLPVVPVAQVTKDRSQEHVAADKHWEQTGNTLRLEPGLTWKHLHDHLHPFMHTGPERSNTAGLDTLQSVYTHLSAVILTSHHRSRSTARCRAELLQEATQRPHQFNDGTLITISFNDFLSHILNKINQNSVFRFSSCLSRSY